MARHEVIEKEFLVKSLEHFLFQVFEGGFDHLIYEDLITLQKTYVERSSEWMSIEHILQEMEKLDDKTADTITEKEEK